MKERGISAAYQTARSKPDLAWLDTLRAVTDNANSRLDRDLVQNLENLAKLAKAREEMIRETIPRQSRGASQAWLKIELPLPRFPAPCCGEDV